MSLQKVSSVSINKKGDVTADRFVLFLDIMGFKDRVARHKHEEVLDDLLKLQKTISTSLAKYKESGVQITLFSDSILLFSPDTEKSSLRSLAQVAKDIMQESISYNIPIKGALAKGKVTCDVSKQLFFGQALIDAYLLQENTKYYGILVHHTAEADAEDQKEYFRDVKAYLRSGRINHYELNWYYDHDENSDAVRKSLYLLRQSVSDEPRKYIDNTLDILDTTKK